MRFSRASVFLSKFLSAWWSTHPHVLKQYRNWHIARHAKSPAAPIVYLIAKTFAEMGHGLIEMLKKSGIVLELKACQQIYSLINNNNSCETFITCISHIIKISETFKFTCVI